jgi:hypothetical protein
MKIIRVSNSRKDQKKEKTHELVRVKEGNKYLYKIYPIGFNLNLDSVRVFAGTKDECLEKLKEFV